MIYLINSIKIFSITLILLLNSCGSGFLNPDWSKTAEPSGKKRARQNVKEGKGYAVDTDLYFNAAGDLFAAGYLHGLINNLSTEACLEKGTELSSKVIQQIGARF